jgi:hypothetical protein
MIIPRRFNGPADTGNGGYSSGLVAGHVEAPSVEVTLRVPPPLDTELTVSPDGDGVAVYDGETLVATGRPGTVTDVVPPVDHEQASRVSKDYPGFVRHPFPTCYACGPERTDGLRLAPGRMADGRTAAPLVVPDDVSPATVWAVLDCPGGWAASLPVDIEARPYVLGRMTARVESVPEPGSQCVVTGLLLGGDGRKAYVATTLWGPDGDRPLATARATWIALR